MEANSTQNTGSRSKVWKEYIFEFIMIFLAVMLGFFAESFREYLAERTAEKQFIQSYIEDLKSDIISITESINHKRTRVQQLDSMMLLLNSQQVRGHENELYFFGRLLTRPHHFQSNDRTISQLNNSGSLRLIMNQQAADSIISYQKLVHYIVINQEDERTEINLAGPRISLMFNPFELDKMVTLSGVKRPVHNPPLRSYDQNVQQDLAYYIHQIKGSSFLTIVRLELLNKRAKNTITFLTKEYDLD